MDRGDRISTVSVQLNALAAQVRHLQEQVRGISTGPPPTSGAGSGSVTLAPGPPTETGTRSTRTGLAHLTVTSHLCLGCGLCARIAPRTFTIHPQTGKAQVVGQGGDPAGIIQMAMARCPVGAIRYR